MESVQMSLKMAHKVIVPQKKIMSRSFLNIGTLIVSMYVLFILIMNICLYERNTT
jgi:hypothetical protein